MVDYLSFTSGKVISDFESSDSEQELNVTDFNLEEELIVQFNNPSLESESLATAPLPAPEASRKRPLDVVPDEEELIKGSGFFVK